MLDFPVAGIPVGMVIVALVEAIKRLFKVEGDRAIAVAIVVGVVVAAGARAAQIWPEFGQGWETAIVGILLGLAACGLFDAGQALKAKLQ